MAVCLQGSGGLARALGEAAALVLRCLEPSPHRFASLIAASPLPTCAASSTLWRAAGRVACTRQIAESWFREGTLTRLDLSGCVWHVVCDQLADMRVKVHIEVEQYVEMTKACKYVKVYISEYLLFTCPEVFFNSFKSCRSQFLQTTLLRILSLAGAETERPGLAVLLLAEGFPGASPGLECVWHGPLQLTSDRLPQLTRLDLQSNKLSHEGIQVLMSALQTDCAGDSCFHIGEILLTH
eukprot:763054-Hanusia_phi.AAC.4